MYMWKVYPQNLILCLGANIFVSIKKHYDFELIFLNAILSAMVITMLHVIAYLIVVNVNKKRRT